MYTTHVKHLQYLEFLVSFGEWQSKLHELNTNMLEI